MTDEDSMARLVTTLQNCFKDSFSSSLTVSDSLEPSTIVDVLEDISSGIYIVAKAIDNLADAVREHGGGAGGTGPS